VGKLVAAFVMFLAASALAIHEAKPPPPPRVEEMAPSRSARPVDEAPPSRAIHDAVPPWVKYAAPPPANDNASDGDFADTVDKCPDQPSDDNDGCPDPEPTQRIISIE
jgi:hypothetical protein